MVQVKQSELAVAAFMRSWKKRLEPAGARWRWRQPDVARGRDTRRDGDAPAWTDTSTAPRSG